MECPRMDAHRILPLPVGDWVGRCGKGGELSGEQTGGLGFLQVLVPPGILGVTDFHLALSPVSAFPVNG